MQGDVDYLAAARGHQLDRPAPQPEDAQLLGGGRINGQPVDVAGAAALLHHRLGAVDLPTGRAAQQYVARQPGAGDERGRPPGVGAEQQCLEQPAEVEGEPRSDGGNGGDQWWTLDPEVEGADTFEAFGKVGTFQVVEAGGIQAGPDQVVVEP